MAKFRRVICPKCGQPLQPVHKGNRTIYICGCPRLERDIGGEDRDIESKALGLGPEEDDEERDKNTPSYGTGLENPILNGLLALMYAGQEVVRVSPGINAKPRPKAGFHLTDGSVQWIEFDADHSTYMRFWKQAAAFKHLLSAAELGLEP